MSEKEKNMFERIAESLKTISENLSSTNDYLIGIGAELAIMNENFKEFKAHIENIFDKPLAITVDTESLTKTLEKQKEVTMPKQAGSVEKTYAKVG